MAIQNQLIQNFLRKIEKVGKWAGFEAKALPS